MAFYIELNTDKYRNNFHLIKNKSHKYSDHFEKSVAANTTQHAWISHENIEICDLSL